MELSMPPTIKQEQAIGFKRMGSGLVDLAVRTFDADGSILKCCI